MAKSTKKEQQSTLKAASKAASLLRWQILILVASGFLLYAQTLRFGLVLDDNMVITDHSVVQQGVRGIGTLLTKDSFYGFDEFYDRASQRKTYRPVSFVSFALEKQLWNNNPAAAHFVNVVLYVIVIVLAFLLLRRLFDKHIQEYPYLTWLPFSAALLFAMHPVHTSVVANIKSRDELFALLFALLSAVWILDYLRINKRQGQLSILIGSIIAFALSLFSKESAVLLLPIFPILMLFTFTDIDTKKIVTLSLPYIAVTVVFLGIWFGLVGRVEEGLFAYKLHNPFVGTSLGERIGTGFVLLGWYVLKVIFPWTLSEGYTYNQIPVVGLTDWRALLSIITVLGLIGAAVMRLGKRFSWLQRVMAFSILAFFITLAVASNLIVYAGSMLGERFLFTPSFFAMTALGYGIFAACGAETKNFHRSWALAAILLITSAYTVRGIMRLPDWASDYRLLLADNRSTPQSMMTARNFASQLIMRAGRAQNLTEQTILLDEAESVIGRALAVDSSADAALYDLQALCAMQRKDFDKAFRMEERAMKLDSVSRDSIHRKPIFLRNLASTYVSRAARRINQDSTNEGIQDLRTALRLNPRNETAYINLGMVFGKQQKLDSALAYFQAAYRINPQSETAQQYIYAIQQAKQEEQEAMSKSNIPTYK